MTAENVPALTSRSPKNELAAESWAHIEEGRLHCFVGICQGTCRNPKPLTKLQTLNPILFTPEPFHPKPKPLLYPARIRALFSKLGAEKDGIITHLGH